ncbi:hypothetical protein GCM10009737_13070 [Nocardioides lentus]|uniref:DUF1800 domain-containing protein n=1 Tax=Nocardioides lentus TaxID=338077 RepID=A0ABN2P5M4_9ACTN
MSSPLAPSRRTLVAGAGGAALAGAGGAVVHAAAPAAAARSTYAPATYAATPVLPAAQRHLVSRFSYGLTPALAAQVRRSGGAAAWFEKQLRPSAVADGMPSGFGSWWPSLSRGPKELWDRQAQEVEGGWVVMQNYQRWVLMRRTFTQRQVAEVMTEFWENHFNVPVNGDLAFTHRAAYGSVVRARALGRFEDLLLAVTTHPAMLIYLDGARSTKARPNENLARELLELHTVGRGTYGEDDVKASARILTGWWVDLFGSWEAGYRTEAHATGPVRVMDFADDNASPDGRDLTRRYLSHLAHHPATAARICRKLALKFVSDEPSEALVASLARVYLANDTAIVPVLRALVASAEFRGSAGRKVRDPGEDVVATYRALGLKVGPPTQGDAAVNAMLWQVANLGTTPLAWPRPDGAPLTGDAWSSPSRVLASFEAHWVLAGGWWPKVGVTYRRPPAWVPRFPITFRLLVDHLSRTVLQRPSTAALLEACCLATGIAPGERITRDHHLVRWNMHRLLATLLDSPAHLTR